MFGKKTTNKFTVKVDDNYHFSSESDRYTAGEYSSLDEAIEKCQEITISSLKHHYEEGISPEDLSAQWALFGDDPFIIGSQESIPFSARKFITTELCQGIIDSMKATD